MSYKVKLRVIAANGKREKYSFHLEEGHQFPLGSGTEGILEGHDSLAPEQCSIVLLDGQIRLIANPDEAGSGLKLNGKSARDSVLQVGDRFQIGSFTIECLELTDSQPKVQAEEPSISLVTTPRPESTHAELTSTHATAPAEALPAEAASLSLPSLEISKSSEPQTHAEATSTGMEPGTLTMIRQEYDNTRVTLQDMTRPNLSSDGATRTNMTSFTDVGEKTSATSLIRRSHAREDKLTKRALIGVGAAAVIAIPLYFGFFSKKHVETTFPVETAAPERAADEAWEKAPTAEDVASAARQLAGQAQAPDAPTAAPAAPAPAPVVASAPVAEPPKPQSREKEQDLFAAAEMTFAASSGNVSALRSIIEDLGVDVNLFAEGGRTALMSASSEGKTEAIQFLLSKGAQVNATDSMGTTALMWATMKGHFTTVQLLVDAGAIAGMPRANGDTAVQIAQRWGHKRIAAFLKDPRAYRAQIARDKARQQREAAAREKSRKAALAKIQASQKNSRNPAGTSKQTTRTGGRVQQPAVRKNQQPVAPKKRTAPQRRSAERPSGDLDLTY